MVIIYVIQLFKLIHVNIISLFLNVMIIHYVYTNCPHEHVPKQPISFTIINYHLDTFEILCLGAKFCWWQILAAPWCLSFFFHPAQFLHGWANFSGSAFAPPAAKFCWLKNFSGDGILLVATIPCHTLAPFHFLELINSLITMYKHNICRGNTSRNQSHNTDLTIYGPQAGWLSYHDGDNGGGSSGASRFVLRNDYDVASGDALCSGHPVQHVPGELARDSGSMSSETSLLRGSHQGGNHFRDNGGGSRKFALRHDDNNATGDALFSGLSCLACTW
jgi:hypothetical protein